VLLGQRDRALGVAPFAFVRSLPEHLPRSRESRLAIAGNDRSDPLSPAHAISVEDGELRESPREGSPHLLLRERGRLSRPGDVAAPPRYRLSAARKASRAAGPARDSRSTSRPSVSIAERACAHFNRTSRLATSTFWRAWRRESSACATRARMAPKSKTGQD